ncbi:MAG: hypothetical protein AAFN79_04870 [Pseudomonadota bacterium]
MSIHLHLGAHKTATTHIQAILRENAPRLAAAGLEWAPPSELRALIGRGRTAAAQMAPIPSLRAAVAAERLRRWARGRTRLILSDENSLGLTTEMMETGALYPAARARLRLLRNAARGRPLAVFLAIRDYAPFFTGVHAQSIRDGAALALTERDLRRLAALPRRWPNVIADIRRALPGAALTIWRFEDYGALKAEIPRLITGIDDLAPHRRVSMRTPSAPAIEAIFAAAAARPDGRIPKEDYARLRQSIDGPRYMPFDERRQARMSAVYAEDIAALKAVPDIAFIEP